MDEGDNELLKMSELARRSGVPAATIKHYVREGLLPEPKRTSRNMAWYDEALIPRIQIIKELQRTRFLPLKVIREVLEETERGDKTLQEALANVITDGPQGESRSRDEVIEAGVPTEQLEWLEKTGLIHSVQRDGQPHYRGDDLAVLKTLGAARRAGLTDEMLPVTILEPYFAAVREIVRTELSLFRKGVLPRAGDNLPELVEVATDLSEKLMLLLRRKLLLPTLEQVVAEEQGTAPSGRGGRSSAGQAPPARKGGKKKYGGK